jgi:hypothetical protein
MENGASACTTFATNETIDFGNSTLEAGNIFSKKRMDNYQTKILRCMGKERCFRFTVPVEKRLIL